jgi:hypothetical protein
MSEESAIVLDGEITDVMETWPLQLAVTTADGAVQHIALSDDVAVVGEAGKLGPGNLRPGMAIRVTATAPGGVGLSAHRVQVLEP